MSIKAGGGGGGIKQEMGVDHSLMAHPREGIRATVIFCEQ